MASFEEKVEALRRLREKRQAREESKQPTAGADAADSADGGYPKSNCQSASAKKSDTDELPDVLQHYAGLQDSAEDLLVSRGSGDEAAKEASDEADALYCLGHCYEQGLHECGCDMELAVKYYRQSAEKGSVVGQWRLGHLHEYGNGVEADDSTAARWYRQAAEAGHSHAQSSLALLLEDGRADSIEDEEAFRWHLAAAEQGNALSQYCAACSLASAPGASQDEQERARSLLEKSAASGFPLAVETLARGDICDTKRPQEVSEDHTNDRHDMVGPDAAGGLLDLAARVAKQIEHLPDAEADAFLETLLGAFDEPSAFGDDSLEDMLANSDLALDGTSCSSLLSESLSHELVETASA